MSWTILLSAGGIFSLLSLLITQLVVSRFRSKLRSQAKKVNLTSLNTFLYLMMAAVLLALPALIFLFKSISSEYRVMAYTFIFFYALLMGVLHYFAFYRWVKWAEKSVDILPDVIFVFIVSVFGTAVFLALLTWTLKSDKSLIWNHIFIILPFVLPMFVYKTYLLFKNIPNLDYELFKISSGFKNVSPEERRNSSRIPISLEIPMSNKSAQSSLIKQVTLLSDIEFGICIYQFVRVHNGKPDRQDIETLDTIGNEYEFLFYHKPNWLGIRRIINPRLSVHKNKISANDIIIAQRFERT